MGTVNLTAETFEQTVAEHDIVFIDFWAAWCGPCQMFAPIYEDAAQRHPDLTFAKVDTEVERELAGRFGIMSIPTLAILREGIMVFSQPGVLPAEALDDLAAQVRALDMDEVRRAIAEDVPAAR
jgi:thioredoxin 1